MTFQTHIQNTFNVIILSATFRNRTYGATHEHDYTCQSLQICDHQTKRMLPPKDQGPHMGQRVHPDVPFVFSKSHPYKHLDGSSQSQRYAYW